VYKYFPESEETQKGRVRNQRQGVWSTKRALTPNLYVLHPVESEAVETIKNAPMVAGGAAQIPGESFQKSQKDAGGPSEILSSIPNILVEEPVALEKKRDILLQSMRPRRRCLRIKLDASPSNPAAAITTK